MFFQRLNKYITTYFLEICILAICSLFTAITLYQYGYQHQIRLMLDEGKQISATISHQHYDPRSHQHDLIIEYIYNNNKYEIKRVLKDNSGNRPVVLNNCKIYLNNPDFFNCDNLNFTNNDSSISNILFLYVFTGAWLLYFLFKEPHDNIKKFVTIFVILYTASIVLIVFYRVFNV